MTAGHGGETMSTARATRTFSLTVIAMAALLAGVLLGSGNPHVTREAAAEAPLAPGAATATAQPFDFASLADRVVPSVVSVFSTDIMQPNEQRREMPMDPFEFFFGPRFRQPMEQPDQPMVRQSAGSGFFISANGELLTNNHVIEGAEKVQIQLNDQTTYDVEVVGSDPATDIAVLKVVKPDREFPILPLGDSNALRVGEWVMAVGNPLNMDHTITVGVVSAKGRVLGLADNAFENFIQTDAAINFGNSGGPLVNIRGEAIGINTAINAGGQNLGFAVPINIAERILPQLRQNGKVVRGYLGAQIRDISPDIQQAFNLPDRNGAFVEEVESGHAAATAGLQHGDAIVAVDGQPVRSPRELIDSVSTMSPGSTVRLNVIREGKRLDVKVKLEERPGTDQPGHAGRQPSENDVASRIGVSVRALTPQLRQMYGVHEDISGVVVTSVDPVSPAGEKGLAQGDVITEVNGTPVATPEALNHQIELVAPGGYLRLYVYRPQADRSFFAILTIPQ
jgi:serine protease Do